MDGRKGKKLGPYGKRKFEELQEENLTLCCEDDEQLTLSKQYTRIDEKKTDEDLTITRDTSYSPSHQMPDSSQHFEAGTFVDNHDESPWIPADTDENNVIETKGNSDNTEELLESVSEAILETDETDDIFLHMSRREQEEPEALSLDVLLDDTFIGTSNALDDIPTFFSSEADEDDTMNSTDRTNDDDNDSKPLYEGSNVTVGAFMLLLAIFSTKYNLIGEGVQQLLNIISIALPHEDKLCKSLHAFKMFFRNLKNPLIRHYYCTFCLAYVTSSESECPVCRRGMNANNKHYFLEVPIADQVRSLFAQEGFYANLQGRFHRNASHKKVADIYDGRIYRSLFDNNGPLCDPANISFVMNTDGAPVFKSSKVSIWPIFLVINELPYKLRMRKENMILAGLWFGNQKPAMGTFLKPMAHSLHNLSKGIECKTPEDSTIFSKCYLLAITADLPARSMVCNSVQFNGSFGCWKCHQKGETAAVGKGHTHVFPFINDDPKGPRRTRESVQSDALQAIQSQPTSNVRGVKGPSWISRFALFNIIDGIAIDYMHGVLLGVQKLLLTLWFSPKHKSKVYNKCDKADDVDRMLSIIHPTLDITRLPRSVSDLKYWKASEYRSFLFFYGCPVLNTILDRQQFNHFACLVNAIHILLGDQSNEEDIDRADGMLLAFCREFEALYERCYMTLNIHQLVHLADCVRSLGPLYTHSCFPYEDKNGMILKLIRGTQNIDSQIITGVSFIQKIPELKQTCILKGSVEESICSNMENTHVMKRGGKIEDDTYILGAAKKRHLFDTEFEQVCDFTGITYLDVVSFMRIEKNGNYIYGTNYARMQKRDNSVISYKSEGVEFGIVLYFLLLKKDDAEVPVAFLEKLTCLRNDNKSNILAVTKTTQREIIPIDVIIDSCMLINTGDKLYICKFPNKLEGD